MICLENCEFCNVTCYFYVKSKNSCYLMKSEWISGTFNDGMKKNQSWTKSKSTQVLTKKWWNCSSVDQTRPNSGHTSELGEFFKVLKFEDFSYVSNFFSKC